MDQRFLYQRLRDAAPKLADSLDRLRQEALAIWQEQHLRAMTEHGEPHLAQVERNLDLLSQPLDLQGSPLSPEEIYVLLAACYLHDIGMQLDVPDARARHAEHSYELILYSEDSAGRKLRVQLPIDDDNARESIAQVARAHWTTYALNLPDRRPIHGNIEGRLRLLGALLATADLLDLSPVRARYFRSAHRLHELPPMSELHQTMHRLVRGFRLEPASPEIPGDLQLQLEWRDNSQEAQMVSDWLLHWITSQLRQLQPLLHQASGGVLRWATPWVRSLLHPALGPRRALSREASRVLRAERLEQQRIDRDELRRLFLEALGGASRRLFLVPKDPEGDGPWLSDWCHAQASSREGLRVARLDVLRTDAPDPSGLLAELLEQWGHHLPEVQENQAFEHLHQELMATESGAVVVLVVEEYSPRLLDRLVSALFARPSADRAPRICVLFSPQAQGPEGIDGVEILRLDWPEISEDDLAAHLRESWGYNEGEIRRMTADSLPFRRSPGFLYNYLASRCKEWENELAAG
jgi:hypothetical protein